MNDRHNAPHMASIYSQSCMEITFVVLSFVGLLGGVMLWSFTTKVLFGVIAAARGASLSNLFGELTPQKVRRVLVFLFVASCVWALAFTAITVHFAIPASSTVGWSWFFGGMAAAPILIWATTLRTLRRVRQRTAQAMQP